jgi:hypothetical protein
MTWFARVMGVITVVYSVVVLLRPRLLVTPTGLVPRGGTLPMPVAALARAVGARDTVIGLAMVFAPGGAALLTALWLRIGSDFADAAIFGLSVTDRSARTKTVAVAAGYGVLNVIALWLAWP